jgi:hypothetical protein
VQASKQGGSIADVLSANPNLHTSFRLKDNVPEFGAAWMADTKPERK